MVFEIFGFVVTCKHIAVATAAVVVPPIMYLMHSGICQRVRGVICRRPMYGKMRIAYKPVVGEFCSRGGDTSFKDIRKVHPGLTTIGIYYGDPIKYGKTSRFIAGVILSEGDDEPAPEVEKKFRELGFSITTLPEVATAVQTSFPVKNNHSFGIGGWKAYPKIMNFIKENNLRWNPAVEIYEKDTVIYMIPQTDGDAFWVPEVSQSFAKDKFQ